MLWRERPSYSVGHTVQSAVAYLGKLLPQHFSSRENVVVGQRTWINTFRARSDRVIAAGRVMLAIGSLYIAWLDATHPPRSTELIFALLLAYFCYAVLAAIVIWRSEIARVSGTMIRHAIDVVAIIVFMSLTDGASSPFFMFMPFTLLAATLHWRWQGALWTSLILVGVLLALVATDTTIIIDLDHDSTTDVSRLLFMLVTAILLIWLGAHQEAVRTELLRLVEKAPIIPAGGDWPASAALDYVAHVMRVPRALLLWSDAEEPWTYAASWKNGVSSVKRLSPSAYFPWTAECLVRASFLISDAERGRGVLVHQGEGRFERWQEEGAPICAALVLDHAISSAISVPFQVDDLEARLFVLDPPALTLDDVAVAEIVADRIRALFLQAMLVRQLSDAAAVEERIKIGRDLHDGVLQSLAGTVLQLQALRFQDTAKMDQRLAAIQSMLMEEQRELRAFIRALEPGHEHNMSGNSQLAVQFAALAERLQKQWSIDFHFTLTPGDLQLPATMIYELTRMASEATANAVRHGAARTIKASLRLDESTITLMIDDDGAGFGFDRRLEHGDLETDQLGPRSLRQRAGACGGCLSIDKVADWTRVVISLPVAGAIS
ncbi:sensor histidine kinase [Mesorhizobium sp. B2-4-1]|nr:sensor histidine kinase [Mesorhizobium sp. B2-4-8]TPL61147.1 sensor histidine kinase [Mesorhizobium sp. B2-4-1]